MNNSKIAALIAGALAFAPLTAAQGSLPAVIPGSTLAHSGNAVTVKAARLDVTGKIAFRISLDTHSVDLDKVDLKTQAVLRSAGGLELKPLSWEAPLGGHHREGQLTFATSFPDGSLVLAKDAKQLVLVVRDVAGVPQRIFRWNLPADTNKR